MHSGLRIVLALGAATALAILFIVVVGPAGGARGPAVALIAIEGANGRRQRSLRRDLQIGIDFHPNWQPH